MDEKLACLSSELLLEYLAQAAVLEMEEVVQIYKEELLRRLNEPTFVTKKMLAKVSGSNENTVRSKIDRAMRSQRLVKGVGFIKVGETVLVRKDKGLSIIRESKKTGQKVSE